MILHIKKIKMNTFRSVCYVVCISLLGQVPQSPINLFSCHSLYSLILLVYSVCGGEGGVIFLKICGSLGRVWLPCFSTELRMWMGATALAIIYSKLYTRALAPDSCPDRRPAWRRIPEAGQCESHQDLLAQPARQGEKEGNCIYITLECSQIGFHLLLFSFIEPHNNPVI